VSRGRKSTRIGQSAGSNGWHLVSAGQTAGTSSRLVQPLISDYENDKLRPHGEMVARFALALEISADELLGVKPTKANGRKPSRKVLRRLEKVEALPPQQQATLLKTIDTFLRGAGAP
jgi:transcriptional regulator with XRE-family HTH domain